MTTIDFTKMHGIGNDYVYIDCTKNDIKDPKNLAIKISDRHFGIGSDGLILIRNSDVADFKMSMFNADGSEAQMCGNGIRCVAKYVYDNKLTNKNPLTIETLAGIKTLTLKIENDFVSSITVDMGAPLFIEKSLPHIENKDKFINQTVTIENQSFSISAVSMGNPHAVIFVKDVKNFPIEKTGIIVENCKELFPEKTNVEFIEIVDNENLSMRVWERGSGETLACGTGACASAVCSYLNNFSKRKVTVHLLGGDLFIDWNEKDNHVYLTGSATTVFTGKINTTE